MTIKRNADGLRQNAQKKRQEAFEKVEQGIQKLIKEKKPITFNAVAEAAEVSKAWLYKEPEVKSRIEQLRAQSQGNKKVLPARQQASDSSKDALIRTLRERVKRLESENKELRRQNEVAYGQIIRIRELEKEMNQLRAEKANRCQEYDNPATPTLAFTRDRKDLLLSLGVNLNSTLERLIRETPQVIVDTAIEALRESTTKGIVRNPNGFLNKAITDAWKPNGIYQECSDMEEFNQWWKWAHRQGLVKAATQIDGVQHVLMQNDEWRPFHEVVAIHSIQ